MRTSRLLLLVVATSALAPLGCGKTTIRVPIPWESDVDAAMARARREDKPIVIYFGAAWDCAAKELEHQTFTDPEVSYLVRRDFVAVHVDTTDDEEPGERTLVQRFNVVGDPTVLVFASNGTTELVRLNEFVEPDRFAGLLARAAGSTRPRALALFRTRASLPEPIW